MERYLKNVVTMERYFKKCCDQGTLFLKILPWNVI